MKPSVVTERSPNRISIYTRAQLDNVGVNNYFRYAELPATNISFHKHFQPKRIKRSKRMTRPMTLQDATPGLMTRKDLDLRTDVEVHEDRRGFAEV